jgi:hypothetical protein
MSENSNGRMRPDDDNDEYEQPQPAEAAPPEKVHVPQYRTSYPGWVAIVLGAVLTVCWLFASIELLLRPVTIIVGEVAVICLAALLWFFSNDTLKQRKPPTGWKSQIMPERLGHMSIEEFDGMRFELKGDDVDRIEEHRVRWATRYSKDLKFLSWVLVFMVVPCACGVAFMPRFTVAGSGAELPQTHNIRELWIIAIPALLMAAWLVRLGWNYSRLMLDESQLYLLRENPAWLPLTPGQHDVIPLYEILDADAEDTIWGKIWGHGTVVLACQKGYGNLRYVRLRRVPRHREFSNAINAMRQKGGMMNYGTGMGMMGMM